MKKSLKLLAALGMLSMLISVVACDMPTEEQLLGATTKEGEEASSSSGESTNSSGSNSSSPIWSKFDGADMQVWEDTVSLSPTADGLEIKIGSKGWWGMCFCNKADVDKLSPDCVTFDMSKVKKITFLAKASKEASMWIAQSNENATDVNHKLLNISTEFEEKTYELQSPGTHDYGLFDLGANDAVGGTKESKVVFTIKNIKFLDANGNEIVPSRNE